jgi:hypothetical protein
MAFCSETTSANRLIVLLESGFSDRFTTWNCLVALRCKKYRPISQINDWIGIQANV